MPDLLAYDVHGEGTPVVLLHGLTFDRSVWRPVEERLGDGIQSIAIDLPGHGDSTAAPAPMPDVAESIHATIEAIGLDEPPLLVGHSISAVISLLYATRHPVRGVVDVDQPLDPRPFAELLQRMAPALRDDFPTAFQPIQNSLGIDLLPEPARSRVLASQRIDRDLVLAYWVPLLTIDPAEARAGNERLMAALDAPFLGLFTRELPPEERRFMAAHLRDVELVEWPSGTHLAFVAEPERFVGVVREFVAQTAPASP